MNINCKEIFRRRIELKYLKVLFCLPLCNLSIKQFMFPS